MQLLLPMLVDEDGKIRERPWHLREKNRQCFYIV